MKTSLNFQMKHVFTSIVFAVLLFTTLSCSDDDEPDNRIEIRYTAVVGSASGLITNINYMGSNGDIVTVPDDSDDIMIVEGRMQWSKTIKVNAPFNAALTATMHNPSASETYSILGIDQGEEEIGSDLSTLSPGMVIPLSASGTVTEE